MITFRLLKLAATGIALLTCGVLTSDAQERLVRAPLDVKLESIDIDYGERRQTQGVILRGETMVVDVGVVNRYGPPAWVEADWLERIDIYFRSGTRFDESSSFSVPLSCDIQPIRTVGITPIANLLKLAADGYQYMRCRLDPTTAGLQAGRYTIVAEWSEAADMTALVDREYRPGAPSALRAMLEFEFREVRSLDDEADLYIHLAHRGRLDGDDAVALMSIERVLQIRPLSTGALYLRGAIKAASGDCKGATTDWLRVATIVEEGLDPAHRRHVGMSDGERKAIADSVRQRIRALKCDR